MKYCPECGTKIEENQKFCPECGYKFSIDEKSIDSNTDKSKCVKCNIILAGYYEIEERHVPAVTKYGIGNHLCENCFDELSGRPTKGNKNVPFVPSTPSKSSFTQHFLPDAIKCPFCSKYFSPHVKHPTSTGGNILRGAVFLPWGVVKAVKNKPFVQCPHCGMKIPQG